MHDNNQWGLAWKLAQRELRAGLGGFRIFLGCLGIGVAAIAGVGTISSSITAGLNIQAKSLLGGDVDLRSQNRPNTTEQDQYLIENSFAMSKIQELRAMASPVQTQSKKSRVRTLVELKGVDKGYPLIGEMKLTPSVEITAALAKEADGSFGAAVDSNLLKRLNINVGDSVKVGEATFKINATIKHEPDKAASVLTFGPRLMVSNAALKATKLLKPGSQVRFHTRVLLEEGTNYEEWRKKLNNKFEQASWRVRGPDEAAPGVRRFIERMTLFLNFISLTALLVGGIGITNAVSGFLKSKTATIATFKCVGATGNLIFKIYLLQILALGSFGIIIGLLFGATIPVIGLLIFAEQIPITPNIGIYPAPLLKAAVFGLLTTLTFVLLPLGQAIKIPATTLFRNCIQPTNIKPGRIIKLGTTVGIIALATLTLISSSNTLFACWFVSGALLTIVLLRFGALILVRCAARFRQPKNFELRLAIDNIHKSKTSTLSIVLSLGLGMSILVAVVLIESCLTHQLNERLPEKAPAFFFIDIQPEQVTEFDKIIMGIEGANGFKRMPSLRGRIVKIDGIAVENVTVEKGSQWAINGDRALTSSATPTEGSNIIKGEWWPENYSGPPLISLDSGLAKGFGVDIGDSLTLNILGREVKGTINSLREIDWRSLRFDFAIIFAPGPLEGAPHTHIAAVKVSSENEDLMENTVSSRFSNITSIRVREALEAAANILKGVSGAISGTTLITIFTGGLVMAGIIAAGQRGRIYNTIIFKVHGATRNRLVKIYFIEYSILGVTTGIIATTIGTLTAWAVIVFLMHINWSFYPQVVITTVIICLFVTVFAGYLGTWKALGEKSSVHLRNR